MAQTAVEWLAEGLNTVLTHEQHMQVIGLFLQAKQMEREQIEKAFDDNGLWQDKYSDSEQYYTQTYECKQTEDLTFKKKSQWTKIDKKQQ